MTLLVAPEGVRRITSTLEEAGFSTWAVGGAVRNALLNLPPGDWDLATAAEPKQVRRIFKRTVPIGIEHGTVGVLDDEGTMYEVTTFRRDVETDGRHAVVAFADRIDVDLARRDFTINAIAWHPLKEHIVDPYDGRSDIERRLVRCVGDPQERLREDYLRILRAMRFAGRFGFEIHEITWDAMRGLVEHLTGLSAERVRDELFKILEEGGDPRVALRLYKESGALAVLFPELEALATTGTDTWAGSHWQIALQTCVRLPADQPALRLAALLIDVPRDAAAALLVRLRLSNAETDRIARLAAADEIPGPEASAHARRRWLSAHHDTDVQALARLQMAHADAGGGDTDSVVEGWRGVRETLAENPPLTVGDLAVDGRDLIAQGMKPGRNFGTILEGLLDWVLEDPSRNTQEALLERVQAGAVGDE